MNPADFTEQLDKILAGLIGLAGNTRTPQSAAAVSKSLLDNHGVHIHWRTIESELRRNKDFAIASKKGGQWVFAPLNAASQRLNGATNDVMFIDPSNAVMATIKLHDKLASLAGLIRICDPYLDSRTLHHLDAITRNVTINFLSFNITDNGTTRSLVQVFAAKHVNLQIRRAHANILHDRYIIVGQEMLILGTSLNGFGKKQSFVIRAGQTIASSLTVTFDDLWSKATPWP
jgi:hypothetical protein